MFLRALTIKGFKSFADATRLELGPGITVVVGPNGSGKSNLVDAIAWVLGAQAPSTVRSAKMDDVIFAGTPGRPALGRAEVSLTIDNSDGAVPIEFSEFTVSRTLFRSGDSEYAINGVPCRLLDVQELLGDAGVGRQQHVIVSQGQIDAVLNARPEDRRAIVEEAAGVRKYRQRRERAQRRLDATAGSLDRAQDLVREVRRQLKPVERQAEAARRHREVQAELTALRRYVAGQEYAALDARLHALGAERERLATEERSVRDELRSLDASVLAAESARARHDGGRATDALARAEALTERARGLAALVAERGDGLQRRRRELLDQGVVATLEAEAAAVAEELTDVDAAVAALAPEVAELERAEGELDAERLAQRLAWEQEDAALAREADGAGAPDGDGGDVTGPEGEAAGEPEVVVGPPVGTEARTRAAEARSDLAVRRVAAERAAGELERTQRRLADLEARLVAATEERDRAAAEHAAVVAALPAAEAAVAASGAELEAAAQALAAADEAAQAARAARDRGAARAEALAAALDEARARAGAERLAGVHGLVGPLVEHVEITPSWEQAVDAALGDALAAVVVDGPEAAREALGALAAGDVDGAVVALGLPGADAHRPAVPEVAGARPVVELVRCEHPGIAALLDRLLAGVVAVPGGWAEALDVAVDHPEVVVVSRSGDRFGPSGWRVGAGRGGVTRAAVAAAQQEAEAAAEAAVAADLALGAARDAHRRAAEASSTATRTFEAAAAHLAGLQQAAERAARAVAERDAERAGVLEATDELAVRAAAEQQAVEALEAELPAIEAAEQAERAAEEARREALAAAERRRREAERRRQEAAEEAERARRAAEAQRAAARAAVQRELDGRARALAALRTDVEVRAAALAERRRGLVGRRQQLEERLAADVAARRQAATLRDDVDRRLAAAAALAAVLDQVVVGAEAMVGGLRDRCERERDTARELSERLDGLHRSRREGEGRLEALRERSRRCELDEAETRLRLDGVLRTIRHELETEPDAVVGLDPPELAEGTSPVTRITELEREVRLLGPVNPLALDELAELVERKAFLEGQLADVKASRRDLAGVIKAVDAEIVNSFSAAFADVAANFADLVAGLFPGGSGRLALTDPDDLLGTGVEVEARPSGKNVRKLSLLSGGERSLVALAFLFAVFRSRPSPFYVLDEVEAALDDVNLHRFLGLLAEFRQDAQLLVVSHQKRTMEAADCLVGVTMPPGKSSKVVVERRDEVDGAA